MLPPNAPAEYTDRQALWNAVDEAEKRADAQTARRFVITLPKELTYALHSRVYDHRWRSAARVNSGLRTDRVYRLSAQPVYTQIM